MGGTVSASENNDELIDKLRIGCIKTPEIEYSMKMVDRSLFFPDLCKKNCYFDMAWRFQNIHISAPNIYCEILEELDIKQSLTFLNIGSGTGYLSSVMGFLLGVYGVNHGIEIDANLIKYSKSNIIKLQNSLSISQNETRFIKKSSKKAKTFHNINYNHSFTCLPLHILKHSDQPAEPQAPVSDDIKINQSHISLFSLYNSFCRPFLFHGNIFDYLLHLMNFNEQFNVADLNVEMKYLTSLLPSYDRIYCGAACEPVISEFLQRLLNINGILVLPINSKLISIRRVALSTWHQKVIMPACFTPLEVPAYFRELLDSYNLTSAMSLEDPDRYKVYADKFVEKCLSKFDCCGRLDRNIPTLKHLSKRNIRHSLLLNNHLTTNPRKSEPTFNSVFDAKISVTKCQPHTDQDSSPELKDKFNTKKRVFPPTSCPITTARHPKGGNNPNKSRRSFSIQIIDFPRFMQSQGLMKVFHASPSSSGANNQGNDESIAAQTSKNTHKGKNVETPTKPSTKQIISEINMLLHGNIEHLRVPEILKEYLKFI